MARKVAVQRIDEADDGKVVLFPVRPGRGRNVPAVDLAERPPVAPVPPIETGERPTVALSPAQRWLKIGIVASLAIHLGLFAALEWRFVNDLERAAGASAAATAEGTIVIPIEVVVQATLPSAPSPTNATVPTAKPVETPNPAPQEQANVPEPELPLPPEPAPVVLDIPVPTEAPKPVLPVEQNAKPQEIEAKETPQAPRLVIERPKQAVKQEQKRKQTQAAPSAAAGARGAGLAGAGGSAQVGGTAAVSSYQALVLAHLQRYRIYPPAARDRGITGVAAVRFALASNGAVISAGLARSSGESILDSAAVDMVRRASPFPPFPPGMGRARLDFAAPIRFDLR